MIASAYLQGRAEERENGGVGEWGSPELVSYYYSYP